MARLVETPVVMTGQAWADYGLIDSGDGRKLERYGPHRFIRPDTQALWHPRFERWASDGEFVPGSDEDGGGRWQFANPVSQEGWPLSWGPSDNRVKFTAQCTPFRHLGFFPDMAPVWEWMGEQLQNPPRHGEGDHPQDGGGAQAAKTLTFRPDACKLRQSEPPQPQFHSAPPWRGSARLQHVASARMLTLPRLSLPPSHCRARSHLPRWLT